MTASHPMICPVCEHDFECRLGYSNVDGCGEANDNIIIMGECPHCGFKVASSFHYDEHSSNQQMRWLNEDTHREVSVTKTTWVAKWMRNTDADKIEGEDE